MTVRLVVAATNAQKMGKSTYHGKGHDSIGHEVVVQPGKVGAPSIDKLQSKLDIDGQRVPTVNGTDDFFLLLLEQLLVSGEMLGYGGSTLYAGQGGDVVQGGVIGEGAGRLRGEEGLVCGERHGVWYTCVCIV